MWKPILAAVVLFAAAAAGPVAAQEQPPARALRAGEALAQAQWRELAPGLSVKRAISEGAVLLTALRMDSGRYRAGVAVQAVENGEEADEFAQRTGAAIAVNGGFFGEKTEGGKLFPVGLLRIGGRDLSRNWTRVGGYLLLDGERPAILPTAPEPPAAGDILQSKPLLIEPGGVWAMNTNSQISRPRTALCLLPEGEMLLLVVSGAGLSLYETGWLLRDTAVGGHFGCSSAIALDGGGSTQLWVRDHPELTVRGETGVHNALVFTSR